MPPSARALSSVVQFGVFELDLESLELRKNGRKLKIEGQPVQLLRCLVERPGHVVSREELQQKLWPSDTFVDFEHGLNSAVKRLRQALDDSADTPRFVETLPRRGYRFVCPVTAASVDVPERRAFAWNGWIAGMVLLVIATLAIMFLGVQRGSSAVPSVSSIAVLPLENLSGAPDQEHLVDGLHDEVITELAQISALKVISRTSVLRYKGQKKPLREIATELGVDGVLEGTVRRDGERWRVTAQLISARDDHHVWAQGYDRGARDLAAIPREIALGIARRLEVTLLPPERARLAKTEGVDPAAYNAYLKGNHHSAKFTDDGFKKAVRYFQEALDIDPTYARAWGGLGGAYHGLSGWGGPWDDESTSHPEYFRLAEAALNRAVALDPTLMEPHRALGRMKLKAWDWQGAAREFERAHELAPNHAGFPVYLLNQGKFDEAVATQRQNAKLNPLGYASQLTVGMMAFMAGHYDEAIASLKKTIDLDPQPPLAHFELAWCYAKKGMYSEAVASCETSLALMRRTAPKTFVATSCEWVYAVAGRRREALELAHRLERQTNKAFVLRLAHVYDALGDRERALMYLQKAYEGKAGDLPHQWYMPMLSDAIKADPRFQEMIRGTGNPWARFPAARSAPSDGKTRAGQS